ncbi:MAG: low molecular weight protein arginine phosphatase [Gemmatimonadota bacterium]|nr:MAG: low molecular weight protein arginine phosphatase [Gemmatimonadota bacterium]
MTSILMVCTGNICRSPLAESLMRAELERLGVDSIEVASAGTSAWDGAPASEGAYLVGLEHGIDLSEHRARLLTREVVKGADLIFTMARHQRARVEDLGGAGRVHVLGEYAGTGGPEAEVSDPFGSGLDVYRETFDQLVGFVAAATERFVRERGESDSRQ